MKVMKAMKEQQKNNKMQKKVNKNLIIFMKLK